MSSIIITGFMGTGKSTVGAALAHRLNYRFIDMDILIEQRQGRTIRKIFETEGEPFFRQLEADLCRGLADCSDCVIATGGGTLANLQNQVVLAAQNMIICLTCDPEYLWQRLSQAANRPMLDSDDRKQKLLSLLAERQPAYARIGRHIDTTNRNIAKIVDEAELLWQNYLDLTPK